MTNSRFWKIVDKYELITDHADDIEISLSDTDAAIKEIEINRQMLITFGSVFKLELGKAY